MDVMRAGIVAMLLLGLTGTASAQNGQPAEPPPAEITIDVSRLPLNLERIQRELRESTVKEERDGLILRYQVEVYGRAPQIDLFTSGDNLATGPVPYGAPTHQEMVDHVTPKEFRSPVMDFGALFRWLADKTKSK
jgi:hypothetical protein